MVRWSQKDGAAIFRTADGKTWQQVDFETNKQELVSQQLAVLDKSTYVAPVLSGGSGSSGGGFSIDEKLANNRIGAGATVAIADTSNWSNLAESELLTSGVIEVILKPMGGGLMGHTYRADVPFSWESGGGVYTIDGDLGSADTAIEATISIQRSAAAPAFGFTGTVPPGKNATRVFLTVQPKVGGGGFAGTTMFRIQGSVCWDHEAANAAIPAGQPMPEPLWYWG
jgi:hypothetical protein